MGGNSEVILSHTTNQLHFYKQLLQNVTLDRNVMIHNSTNIRFLPPSQVTLNHWIIQNADQHDMNIVKLCPKTKKLNEQCQRVIYFLWKMPVIF